MRGGWHSPLQRDGLGTALGKGEYLLDGYQFKVDLGVRDYECDFQGVVNNAVYQNYLEHANHEFLKRMDLDTVELQSRGYSLIISRIEMDFRQPLRPGDTFSVCIRVERASRLRYVFHQNIYRQPDNALVLTSRLVTTSVNAAGRPEVPQFIEEKILPWCGLVREHANPAEAPGATDGKHVATHRRST